MLAALSSRAIRSSTRPREGDTAEYDPCVVVDRGSGATRWGFLRRSRGTLALTAFIVALALATPIGLAVSSSSRGATVKVKATCAQQRVPATNTGSPTASFLSILSVLRRPATPADGLIRNAPSSKSLQHGAFTGYIRLARVVSRTAYYVIPKLLPSCAASKPIEVVALYMVGADFGGGLYAFSPTKLKQQGAFVGIGGAAIPHLTVMGLVPDGVASVTLDYAAKGSRPTSRPAVAITSRAVNNVVVFAAPRDPSLGPSDWSKMTWRAADGTTIKTFSRL
jgi:hypothetical protein